MVLYWHLLVQANPLLVTVARLLGLSLATVPQTHPTVPVCGQPDASPECTELWYLRFAQQPGESQAGGSFSSLGCAHPLHMPMASGSLSLRSRHPGCAQLTRECTPKRGALRKPRAGTSHGPSLVQGPWSLAAPFSLSSACLAEAGCGKTDTDPLAR